MSLMEVFQLYNQQMGVSISFCLSQLSEMWVAQRLCIFKHYWLGKAIDKAPSKLGRLSFVDELIGGLVFMVTALFLLDILDVEMGAGVKSMFAFGSAGTLVIGLASRDVAVMFVLGLTLQTTDRYAVIFGD
jgi:small-conductance mechanosensitive channel